MLYHNLLPVVLSRVERLAATEPKYSERARWEGGGCCAHSLGRGSGTLSSYSMCSRAADHREWKCVCVESLRSWAVFHPLRMFVCVSFLWWLPKLQRAVAVSVRGALSCLGLI